MKNKRIILIVVAAILVLICIVISILSQIKIDPYWYDGVTYPIENGMHVYKNTKYDYQISFPDKYGVIDDDRVSPTLPVNHASPDSLEIDIIKENDGFSYMIHLQTMNVNAFKSYVNSDFNDRKGCNFKTNDTLGNLTDVTSYEFKSDCKDNTSTFSIKKLYYFDQTSSTIYFFMIDGLRYQDNKEAVDKILDSFRLDSIDTIYNKEYDTPEQALNNYPLTNQNPAYPRLTYYGQSDDEIWAMSKGLCNITHTSNPTIKLCSDNSCPTQSTENDKHYLVSIVVTCNPFSPLYYDKNGDIAFRNTHTSKDVEFRGFADVQKQPDGKWKLVELGSASAW